MKIYGYLALLAIVLSAFIFCYIKISYLNNKLLKCELSNSELNAQLLAQNMEIERYKNTSSKSLLNKEEDKIKTQYKYITIKDNSCQAVLDGYLNLIKGDNNGL